jgi:hypothetical protein
MASPNARITPAVAYYDAITAGYDAITAGIFDPGNRIQRSPCRAAIASRRRLRWVISGHQRMSDRMSALPRKRTLRVNSPMSALGQKRTFRALLDYLVSDHHHGIRHDEPDCLGGFLINDHHEFSRQLNW